MNDVLTLILALIGACSASVVTTIATRPKVRAEASAAAAGGEVALSAEAREWVREFAAKAQAAETAVTAAQVRATAAEARADEVERRCDDVEHRFDLLVDHARILQLAVLVNGGTLPKPPDEILADLGPPPMPPQAPSGATT